MDLLRSGAPSPDLYGVDTIWCGEMSDYLIDLQPYLASEISSQDRDILNGYMVHGKLLAMPNNPNLACFGLSDGLACELWLQNPSQNLG